MKIFEKHPAQETVVWRYVIPALMLPSIAWLDAAVTQVILAPFLSLLCLIILALKLSRRTLCLWMVLYASFVFYMLYQANGGSDPSITRATMIVRAATFFLSSMVVYWVCCVRENLSKIYQSMLQVVANLPIPVLLSDESGLILFSNEKARQQLGLTGLELQEQTYFQLFGLPEQQGQFIASYLAFLEKTEDKSRKVVLASRRDSGRLLFAQWQGTLLGGSRIMITVISKDQG
jgi:PAS domain-containing protein